MEKYRRQKKKHLIPRKLSLVSVLFLMVSQFIFTRMFWKEIDQAFIFFDLNIYQPYQGVWQVLGWVGIAGLFIFMGVMFVWFIRMDRELEKKEKEQAKDSDAQEEK